MAELGIASRPTTYSACERYVVTMKLSAKAVEKLKELLKKDYSFHLFTKLPPELRIMIWRHAVYLQDRLVKFRRPTGAAGGEVGISIDYAPMPPLFLVTKEAYYGTRSLYVRLGRCITFDSLPEAAGPLISFENDIFFLTDYFPMFGITRLWSGYRPLTKSAPGHVPSFTAGRFRVPFSRKCLQVLPLRGCRRFAIKKENYMPCLEPMCGCNFYCSPLTEIEAIAFMMDVDELRVISHKGNHLSITRKDLELLDIKSQRNIERSERARRCYRKFRGASQRASRVARRTNKWDRVRRIKSLKNQWTYGTIKQDMDYDRYWYPRMGEDSMLKGQLPDLAQNPSNPPGDTPRIRHSCTSRPSERFGR